MHACGCHKSGTCQSLGSGVCQTPELRQFLTQSRFQPNLSERKPLFFQKLCGATQCSADNTLRYRVTSSVIMSDRNLLIITRDWTRSVWCASVDAAHACARVSSGRWMQPASVFFSTPLRVSLHYSASVISLQFIKIVFTMKKKSKYFVHFNDLWLHTCTYM